MARPLRIELAGGLYHGMSRGNERRAIVREDADRQRPRLLRPDAVDQVAEGGA